MNEKEIRDLAAYYRHSIDHEQVYKLATAVLEVLAMEEEKEFGGTYADVQMTIGANMKLHEIQQLIKEERR